MSISETISRIRPGGGRKRNFTIHVGSLSLSKVADGLIDPKLVLSWLLSHLGASSFWVGLLVPVREAGALLPQLFTAERIRAMPRRKWAWAAGSLVQGFAAIGIGFSSLALEGGAAGAAIVGLLAVLALARSVCSVSYKDVLGSTVEKRSRGQATGTAASVAAAGTLAFGLVLLLGLVERMDLVVGALFLAGGCWCLASALFSTLSEEAGEREAPRAVAGMARRYWSYLRNDPQLRIFLWTRGLLVSTALAPPYLLLLAGPEAGGAFDRLGALVIASALASLASGWLWGRLADRSSRMVLSGAGLAAALALGLAATLAATGRFASPIALPLTLFVLMVAYQGVRVARSTHLVDMADEETRAGYTAVANTVIGLVLLGSGLAAAVASAAGPLVTVTGFAAMSASGALVARRLENVQA